MAGSLKTLPKGHLIFLFVHVRFPLLDGSVSGLKLSRCLIRRSLIVESMIVMAISLPATHTIFALFNLVLQRVIIELLLVMAIEARVP